MRLMLRDGSRHVMKGNLSIASRGQTRYLRQETARHSAKGDAFERENGTIPGTATTYGCRLPRSKCIYTSLDVRFKGFPRLLCR